jgi:hypothetical protein
MEDKTTLTQKDFISAAKVLNAYKEECPSFPSGSFARFIEKHLKTKQLKNKKQNFFCSLLQRKVLF